MLQHEHVALFRGQLQERTLERPGALGPLQLSIGPPGPRNRFVRVLERPTLARPAAPLGKAPVAQDQEEPARKLGRLPAGRQLIERPDQRVLNGILGGVARAQHTCGIARITVAVTPDEDCILIRVPGQHRPHRVGITNLFPQTQPSHLTHGNTQDDARRGTGYRQRTSNEESPTPPLVTLGPPKTWTRTALPEAQIA